MSQDPINPEASFYNDDSEIKAVGNPPEFLEIIPQAFQVLNLEIVAGHGLAP